MISQTSVVVGTYNYLNPFHGVKWAEQAALTNEGLQATPATLKASTLDADDTAWKKYSNWPVRCPLVAQNLTLADIICLQEVSRETISDLLQLTADKGYPLACAVFHKSGTTKEEFGNAIFFNSKKVTLKKSFEAQHLPPDGWTRSAACAVFDVSGKVFKIASCHLSGYTPTEPDFDKKQASKIKGHKELEDYVSQLEGEATPADCIVIGGDFNEDISEHPYDHYRLGYLLKQGYRSDGNAQVTEPLKNRRIDWLCFKGPYSMRLQPMSLETQQRQASDHLLTGTTVLWYA